MHSILCYFGKNAKGGEHSVLRRHWFFTILLITMVFSSPISAKAQNLCPEEFEPDRPEWVLTNEAGFREVRLGELHLRKFFYQPDVGLRIGARQSNGCSGEVLSFFSLVTGKQERVIMRIGQEGGSLTAYLKTEDGAWHKSTQVYIEESLGEEIRVRLYNGQIVVAERTF